MDKTAGTLSSYAARLRYRDVTPQALHAVKRSLIDSVGCAFGAYAAEPVKIARRIAARATCASPASVLGTQIKTTPDRAAFVNGIMVRYLDFSDDYIVNDGPHPSDNIAALLALAESRHASGKDFATSIVVAYELVGRLVDAAHFRSRGWDYVTETAIGTALAAGNLMGLAEPEMAHALALATAPNISLRQTRAGELSMWKGCAGSNAARNGLFAAELAQEGMTGPDEVVEGQYGLWKQVTGEFGLAPFGGEGRRFKIEDTFFKSIPVMYNSMCPVEAVLKLRGQFAVEDVESILVEVDAFSLATGDSPAKHDPQTRETADHSTPYLVVAALLDGGISERTFERERFRDPVVLELLQRVEMREDPAFTRAWPGYQTRITVRGRSGGHWQLHHRDPKGHPKNPMSDEEIERKFLGLTAQMLGDSQARHALDLIWKLEDIADLGELLQALVI